MFVLNSKHISEVLASCQDYTSEELVTIPEGMTSEETTNMLRCLAAVRPEEIQDIPTEEIVKLFDLVLCVAPHIGNSSVFEHFESVKSIIQNPGKFSRRRVL